MKKEVSQNEFRKYYLSEFELYDGEAFITFNIVSIDTEKREIVVAVPRGRIGEFSKCTFWCSLYSAIFCLPEFHGHRT